MENNNCPRLSSLAFLGFEINSLPERCNVDIITFDYIYKGIEEKNLLEKLENDFKENIDLSLFGANDNETKSIYNVLGEAASGLEGNERRKVGIENSGQRLLVAFILEVIQHKRWN
jgi:hypothetical protein